MTQALAARASGLRLMKVAVRAWGAGAAASDMRVTVEADRVGNEEVIRISLATDRFSRYGPDAPGPDAPGADAEPSAADGDSSVRVHGCPAEQRCPLLCGLARGPVRAGAQGVKLLLCAGSLETAWCADLSQSGVRF